MGHVFKAWDCQNQFWVVVKAIDKKHELVQRLKREADTLRRLNDPRIVRLLDCGIDKDLYFLVLEYLEGKDLGMCIDTHDLVLTQEFCISIGVQILEGVEPMHTAGVVHRDIKPANVFLVSGQVKILDFGLVKLVNRPGPRRRMLTNYPVVIGTLGYLSPEQMRGEEVDCRSDLYACGIVLYELLTGELPFYKTGELEYKAWKKAAAREYWERPLRPFPSIFRVPKRVQEVVWKALAVDPANRYQTAQEMRLALLAARPFSFKRFVKEAVGTIGGKTRNAWRAIWS
ncbi:MAG: serine/threonine protein kinase [Candidatus Magasanikbacteria bacterium]|nr:serine/threonine protein kinase [Candidatus Magasanikbacteria bacterium]